MQKDVSGLVATLARSVIEISGSGAENRDELLQKSIAQFETALFVQLEPVLPSVFEPLAKGLNHIAMFANTLRDAARSIEAIKTGKPTWMSGSNGDMPAEICDEDIADRLDRFIDVGVLTLRAMVNDSAELPLDEDDLERAEAAGELVKIDGFDGTEYLVKSALPAELHDYMVGPYDMVSEYATVGRMFTDEAIGIIGALAKVEAIPLELIDAFPELFEPMGKADDETLGAGGDPNAAPDPGDAAGDDATQNPVELMVRMASIIVVVGGSLLQAQQGGDTGEIDGQQDAGADGAAVDPNNPANDDGADDALPIAAAPKPPVVAGAAPPVHPGATAAPPVHPGATAAPPPHPGAAAPPVQPGAPDPADKKKNPFAKQVGGDFADIPLAKILGGEIVVSDSVADALEEGMALRKSVASLTAAQTASEEVIRKMQGVIDLMNAQPAAPKGALFALGKGEDSAYSASPAVGSEARIAKLAEVNPDAAAKELLKIVHGGGGTPMVPPSR